MKRDNIISIRNQHRELRKQGSQCTDVRKTNSQKESRSVFRNVYLMTRGFQTTSSCVTGKQS
jgi:hypothetical protein